MTPRIGFGYDVHRSTRGDKVRLASVDIPAPFSLQAHSDGDVLIHAAIDALLGALALGDIGTHFPDDDPSFQNASGRELLERTLPLVREKGYRLGNLDATIIAERPKLKPFIPEMRKALSHIGGWEEGKLSLKATTHEELGPIGRREGIAAHVTVLLIPSDRGPQKDG